MINLNKRVIKERGNYSIEPNPTCESSNTGHNWSEAKEVNKSDGNYLEYTCLNNHCSFIKVDLVNRK